MHFVTAAIGFVALIGACFVMARRFNTPHQRGWKLFSQLTGIIFLAGFIGIAEGLGNSWAILGFWIAVIFALAWISAAVSAKLKVELR
jgi:hypothetical protein